MNEQEIRRDRIEQTAKAMLQRADHWYWAERGICGFATHTEPPCVKSPWHDGDHDGTYQTTPHERLVAWLNAGAPLPRPGHGDPGTDTKGPRG